MTLRIYTALSRYFYGCSLLLKLHQQVLVLADCARMPSICAAALIRGHGAMKLVREV